MTQMLITYGPLCGIIHFKIDLISDFQWALLDLSPPLAFLINEAKISLKTFALCFEDLMDGLFSG